MQATGRVGFIKIRSAWLFLGFLIRSESARLHRICFHEGLAALVDGDGLRGGLLAQFGEDGGVFGVGGEVGVLGGIGFMGNL